MNHSQNSSKKAMIFGNTTALALLILSLYCFLGVWIPVIKGYFKDGFEPFDIIFLFIFPIPSSIFAVYCLVVASRVYKGLTKDSLRNVCFVSSLIIFLILFSISSHIIRSERSTIKWDVWLELNLILCMIPVGLFYWLTNKYLIRWLGFDTSIDWQKREKTVKRFFGLMAIFIWSLCMLITEYMEKDSVIQSPLWVFGVLLLPLALAFIFYKLSMRIAMRSCPKKQHQTSEAVEVNNPINK